MTSLDSVEGARPKACSGQRPSQGSVASLQAREEVKNMVSKWMGSRQGVLRGSTR